MRFLILALIFPFFASAVTVEEDAVAIQRKERAKISVKRSKKKNAYIKASNNLMIAYDNAISADDSLVIIAEWTSRTTTTASQAFPSEDSITIALKDLSTAAEELSKVATQENRKYAFLNTLHSLSSKISKTVDTFYLPPNVNRPPSGIESDLKAIQELINMILQSQDAKIEELLERISTALNNVSTALRTTSSVDYNNPVHRTAIRDTKKAVDTLTTTYQRALEAKGNLGKASTAYKNCPKSFMGKSLL